MEKIPFETEEVPEATDEKSDEEMSPEVRESLPLGKDVVRRVVDVDDEEDGEVPEVLGNSSSGNPDANTQFYW